MRDHDMGGTVPKQPTMQFLGAAGTVTGSRYLIDTGTAKVLVDAGMFQGEHDIRERNFQPFPIPASEIDAIVLTHGHLDHAGYIPKLVKDGFTGPIYATKWTGKIAELVLLDSGHIQEMEAKPQRHGRHGRHGHQGNASRPPRPPLYTKVDAVRAMEQFKEVPFDKDFQVAPGVVGHLRPAGHILGSASVELDLTESGKKIVFSGDLGRNNHPILMPPEAPPDADVMVVESTYGDREHQPEAAALGQLASVLTNTIGRGGSVIMPAFAVDRTEVILRQLGALMRTGAIPRTPVYVDGRMAVGVLDIYRQAMASHDPELRPITDKVDPFNPVGELHEVRNWDERQALAAKDGVIIVSSSGMVSGGPVVGHLSQRLADPRNSVVLAGYQAEGTNGRRLANGTKSIYLDHHQVPVAAEIHQIGLSAHADGPELVQWLGSARAGVTYPVHGETDQASGLRQRIQSGLHRTASVPKYLEKVPVGAAAPEMHL